MRPRFQIRGILVLLALGIGLGTTALGQGVGATFYLVMKLGATLQLTPTDATLCPSGPATVRGHLHAFVVDAPFAEARTALERFAAEQQLTALTDWERPSSTTSALRRQFVSPVSTETRHVADLVADPERSDRTILCMTTVGGL